MDHRCLLFRIEWSNVACCKSFWRFDNDRRLIAEARMQYSRPRRWAGYCIYVWSASPETDARP